MKLITIEVLGRLFSDRQRKEERQIKKIVHYSLYNYLLLSDVTSESGKALLGVVCMDVFSCIFFSSHNALAKRADMPAPTLRGVSAILFSEDEFDKSFACVSETDAVSRGAFSGHNTLAIRSDTMPILAIPGDLTPDILGID
jgi:hypothetical protein